jgi:hypothetical protein
MVNGWAVSFVSRPGVAYVDETGPRDGDVACRGGGPKMLVGLVQGNEVQRGALVRGTRVPSFG